MTKRSKSTIFGILISLSLASSANAYHGGGRGGGHGAGGGSRGGGGGAHPAGGYHASAPAFNRTPSFSTPRAYSQPRANPGVQPGIAHPGAFSAARQVEPRRAQALPGGAGSVNRGAGTGVRPGEPIAGRGTNINVNRSGTINNINGNRPALGWHNPYLGYHQGWVHGYWNGHYPGGWAWRGGNGYPGFGYWGGYGGYPGYGGFGWGLGPGLGLGLGMGLGYGLSSWLFGPMLYNWGYSSYANPYYGGAAIAGGPAAVAGQPIAYDYSQPINALTAPADESVTTAAMSTFDQARDAFAHGDYSGALSLADTALRQLPNDPTLHEFRALCLFALGRYNDTAAALYAVLSVGPGWDWTTLIGLYGNPESYNQQLRALEEFCNKNPQSAAGRFVLAYHYLTEGHPEAALVQLKRVAALQPSDQLSAQLVRQLEQPQLQASAGAPGEPNTGTPPAGVSANPPGATPPAGAANLTSAPASWKEGKPDGTWTAQPSKDTTITVTFPDPSHFRWTVQQNGRDHQIEGTATLADGILTLAQDQSNALVGDVNWQDESHFQFKVMGAGPSDPGLSFVKSS
jgi:tetratricopeptide (TPR) repeat protein